MFWENIITKCLIKIKKMNNEYLGTNRLEMRTKFLDKGETSFTSLEVTMARRSQMSLRNGQAQ